MRQFLNPTRSLLAALGALLPAGIALGALEALERSPGQHWHLLWWGRCWRWRASRWWMHCG